MKRNLLALALIAIIIQSCAATWTFRLDYLDVANDKTFHKDLYPLDRVPYVKVNFGSGDSKTELRTTFDLSQERSWIFTKDNWTPPTDVPSDFEPLYACKKDCERSSFNSI